MATKPKAKAEATTVAAPKPSAKSAPKTVPAAAAATTPKAAAKSTPAAVVKETRVPVKAKSAPKVAVKPEPKPISKTVAKVPAKPEPKPAAKLTAKTAKPVVEPKVEAKPKAKPAAKADSSAATKVAQKAVTKNEEKTVPKAAPAMPQKGGKWQEIKVILEKIKEDTLREISKSVKNGTDAVATNEPGGDIYDQASSERDRELGLLLGDREREKLHSIDEALLRIVEDEYGICEECDEDIPLGRLKAMPFTRHCVKCKSDLEKLQAQTKRFEEDRAYREIPLGSEEDEA